MASCLNILFVVIGVGMAVHFSNAFVLENIAVVPLSDGGRDADPNGIARSVVQIVENGQTVCGGSIIDSFTVVTARHCFQDDSGKFVSTVDNKFEVVYDSVQLYDPDNEDNFRRISIQDDGYHHHDSLDVTVLSLSTEMIDAAGMDLDKDSSTQCDMPVQLYGFGDIDDQENFPNVMQVLDTVVKNGCDDEGDDTDEEVDEDEEDENDRIVTRIEGKTSCQGDSGGPLINMKTGQMVSIHVRGSSRPCVRGTRNYSIKLSSVIDLISANCKQC